jgi:hypothetical protein
MKALLIALCLAALIVTPVAARKVHHASLTATASASPPSWPSARASPRTRSTPNPGPDRDPVRPGHLSGERLRRADGYSLDRASHQHRRDPLMVRSRCRVHRRARGLGQRLGHPRPGGGLGVVQRALDGPPSPPEVQGGQARPAPPALRRPVRRRPGPDDGTAITCGSIRRVPASGDPFSLQGSTTRRQRSSRSLPASRGSEPDPALSRATSRGTLPVQRQHDRYALLPVPQGA